MEELRGRWNALYREKLPSLARQRDPAQHKWPVTLDHCFARIILDNAVGKDQPWANVVKAPAVKNMSSAQLTAAIQLGDEICDGTANLVDLDQRSLNLRGKTKYGGAKRGKAEESKSANDGEDPGQTAHDSKRARTVGTQDIRSAFRSNFRDENDEKKAKQVQRGSKSPSEADHKPLQTTSKKVGKVTQLSSEELEAVRSRITSDRSLSAFRQHILILLAQVPRGRFTTYKALAEGYTNTYGRGKDTNARAVGSAMRNNPFAPDVPCHRVLAANGEIGGFGGEWGENGKHAHEKRRLLRDEGIQFDGKGRVVGSAFTDFFSLDERLTE